LLCCFDVLIIFSSAVEEKSEYVFVKYFQVKNRYLVIRSFRQFTEDNLKQKKKVPTHQSSKKNKKNKQVVPFILED
jgi:hypothetical protein